MPLPVHPLDNAAIAELLAVASASAKFPLQRALRRASRRAFLWPEEAAAIVAAGRSLTELSGVGPHLERLILGWLEDPPDIPDPPAERVGFLTIPAARAVLAGAPSWAASLRGDLQTHSEWSDGSGTIAEMADAAAQRGYEYIAITDHAKGLKIAGGINEAQLAQQAVEIKNINAALAKRGAGLTILRSIELNLNPRGEGDMLPSA